jgi:hypothetical protein
MGSNGIVCIAGASAAQLWNPQEIAGKSINHDR